MKAYLTKPKIERGNMRGLFILPLISAIFLIGCEDNPIKEKPPPTSEYRGIYCEYRNLEYTFIEDCLSIEITFTDQKAYYTMFPEGNFDTVICEARTKYWLEDSLYFDSAATVFNPNCQIKIYFSGGYEIQFSTDSLFFHRYDYQSEIGVYVNAKPID